MNNLILLLLYFLFAIFWIFAWIKTAIHQAKRKRWTWFVFTLIFQVVLIIYWLVYLFDSKFRRKKAF